MEHLYIEGGRPLVGTVRVSGAKNAVLKLMAASLMTPEECVIRNVPLITDVFNMIAVLRGLGAEVQLGGDGVMRVRSAALNWVAPDDSAREMRASIQVMGPLLGRLRRVSIAHPGGCAIGSRPIDLHLAGLRRMGVTVAEEFGHISGVCDKLTGAEIHLDYPSVGATENLMMAATLASGITTIYNCAREPEIIEVQTFLNCMGAKVRGAGTDVIRVSGVTELGGADLAVLPDRIEAGTYLTAAVMTRGELILEPVITDHLQMLLAKLREAGAEVEVDEERVYVRARSPLRPLQVRSAPHPGFPTDMQPQFVAMLTLAQGTSIVSENVYSNRFQHVNEFIRMGADIRVDGRIAVIRGPGHLTGAQVHAWDLRAGAAVVLAGLAADGITKVENVYHIDRGYEKLEAKLRGVGACIERREAVAVGEPVLV